MKGVRMNRIVLTYGLDDFQIVDVVSRGILLRSLLVGRRVSRHVLRATVVDGVQRKLLIYFPVRPSTRGKKGSPVQRSTRDILRSRGDRSTSYLLLLILCDRFQSSART